MEQDTKPEKKQEESEGQGWPVPDEEIDRVIRLLEEGWER